MSLKSVLAAVAVFVLLIGGGVGFGMYMTIRHGGTVNLDDLKPLIVPAVGLIFYIAWVGILLGLLRPRIAGFLSRLFRVTVEESLSVGGLEGGGGWTTTTGRRFWKSLLIHALEVLIFVPLLFGPILAVLLPIF